MKIEMPNIQTIKAMRYAHSMTSGDAFHQVFKDTGENHMRGYIDEQWVLWLTQPLAFMLKWPVQAEMIVVRYHESKL